MRLGNGILSAAACISLASIASASTIVVDANGGGQFTDLPAAIAFAQAGDVIVVQPGTYGGFGLTKSLTIVGTGVVTLNSPGISIGGIPAGGRAVVTHLRASALSIAGCAGHVIVQEVGTPPGYAMTLGVTQCDDVRLRDVTVGATTSPSLSRIEMARCTVHGSDGTLTVPTAGSGIESNDHNRLHLALTSVFGGTGADSTSFGGPGGIGLILEHNDTCIFAGGGLAQIRGGDGGFGPDGVGPMIPCYYNGPGGGGVAGLTGSDFTWSGGIVQGGNSWQHGTCAPLPQPGIVSAGTVTAAVPDDPTLDLVGTPAAGSNVQFVVRAPVGSITTLYVGRNAVVIADGLATIEQLATHARAAHLGVVSGSGQVTVSWNVPANLSTGTFLIAQAELVLPGGELRRTNSVPIVVR